MVTTAAKPDAPEQAAEQATDDPYLLAAPVKLKLPDCWEPTDEALIEISRINEPWDFELTADRELVFVSPERPGSSARGIRLSAQIDGWSETTSSGHVFGPHLGVRNEDGSMRMPDAAWISEERWGDRDLDEKGLLDACPELIVEIVSATDLPTDQQEKMEEWIGHGADLGWLIDPFREIVLIYRPNAEPERLERPDSLSGEDVCGGLEVSLERIWK